MGVGHRHRVISIDVTLMSHFIHLSMHFTAFIHEELISHNNSEKGGAREITVMDFGQ